MLQHDRLLSRKFAQVEHCYTCRDTILYALGVGANSHEFDLIYERSLRALPSMATVLAYPGNWYADPSVELNELLVVHGSERIELHRTLPVEGHVVATPRISAIHGRGSGRWSSATAQFERSRAGNCSRR